MVGKNYLSQRQILQDISNNIYSLSKIKESVWYSVFPQSFLLTFIFKQSIISQQDYYKTCVLISYKTSNNQSEIDKMPFYIFNNFIGFLNEIIEEENKSNTNDNDSSSGDMMKSANNMFKDNMSAAKSAFGNIHKPKL